MLARLRTLADEERWLALIAEHDKRRGTIEAEVFEEAKANWYLVHAFAGEDVRAMRWLARRRFGVFRPMEQRKEKRNGYVLQGWQPIFSGWLFVYVFEIEKCVRRIKSCPGVFDVLCDPVSQKPYPIPDSFVQELREEGWNYNDQAPRAGRGHVSVTAQRHVGRVKRQVFNCDKKMRKTLARLKEEAKNKFAWDPKTWATINALAPHQRIAFLERKLNAPSLGV